jgi:hypothetical protein
VRWEYLSWTDLPNTPWETMMNCYIHFWNWYTLSATTWWDKQNSWMFNKRIYLLCALHPESSTMRYIIYLPLLLLALKTHFKNLSLPRVWRVTVNRSGCKRGGLRLAATLQRGTVSVLRLITACRHAPLKQRGTVRQPATSRTCTLAKLADRSEASWSIWS